MTLLYMDGFKHGDTTNYDAGTSIAGTFNQSSAGRLGSGYILGASVIYKSFVASAMVGCGVAMFPTSTNLMIIGFLGDAGATTHITLVRNTTSGFLEARRGSSAGTLLATGTTPIPISVWVHVEAQVTIADSGGTVKVRINGATTNDIDFTGDTKNAGTNTTVDKVLVNMAGASSALADWYIYNGSGSVNNDWLGDCKVAYCTPSGNGNTSQGVNSGGNSSNNYTTVDELPFSSTDYVGVTTAGQGDTYTLTDLPAGTATVKAVQVRMSAAKSDAGAKSIKRRLRSGGTTYAGSAIALSTSYVSYVEVVEADPATSTAWTPSGVNSLEAGFEAA